MKKMNQTDANPPSKWWLHQCPIQYLLVAFLLIVPMSIQAQIKVRKTNVKNVPVIKPVLYDSLRPFTYTFGFDESSKRRADRKLSKYIGHKIFFVPFRFYGSKRERLHRKMTMYYLNKEQKIAEVIASQGEEKWKKKYISDVWKRYVQVKRNLEKANASKRKKKRRKT